MRRWVSRNPNQPVKEVNLNDMRVLNEQHYAPPNVAPRASNHLRGPWFWMMALELLC